MNKRDKNSFLNLIHYVLQLLLHESKLKRQIFDTQNCIDGMTFNHRECVAQKEQLERIQFTLNRICKTHMDLVDLLRERLRVRDDLQHHPFGNAGYYREIKLRDQLDFNKSRINHIINPTEFA